MKKWLASLTSYSVSFVPLKSTAPVQSTINQLKLQIAKLTKNLNLLRSKPSTYIPAVKNDEKEGLNRLKTSSISFHRKTQSTLNHYVNNDENVEEDLMGKEQRHTTNVLINNDHTFQKVGNMYSCSPKLSDFK